MIQLQTFLTMLYQPTVVTRYTDQPTVVTHYTDQPNVVT
jgi:hypothetical protein